MNPHRVRGRLVWRLCLGVLSLLPGCDRGPKAQEEKGKQTEQFLPAEVAKQALLEMGPQIPPGIMIPPPKDEPIEFLSANEMAVGIWKCDLKKRTFHAEASYPQALRHKFNQVNGVFEQTPAGKWVAKVTNSTSSD